MDFEFEIKPGLTGPDLYRAYINERLYVFSDREILGKFDMFCQDLSPTFVVEYEKELKHLQKYMRKFVKNKAFR